MKLRGKDWFLICVGIIFLWGLDFSLKKLALGLSEEGLSYGPIHFDLHFNKGFIMSSFQGISKFLLEVVVSTLGAFLLFIYIFIQHLIGTHSLRLRLGLVFLVSGICGNVTDRLLYRMVVDYVWIDFGFFRTGVFNLADFVQWIGCGLLFIGAFAYREAIFPEKDSRSYTWVHSSFQIRYIFTFIFISLGFSLISGVFFHTYYHFALSHAEGIPEEFYKTGPFMLTYIVITLQFCVTLWIVGRVLSHRLAGPLYSFEQFLIKMEKGEDPGKFKLRKTDEFNHLEELALKVKSIQAKASRAKDRPFHDKK